MKSFIFGILGVGIGSLLSWTLIHDRLDQNREPVSLSNVAESGSDSATGQRISVLEKELDYYRDQYRNLLEKVIELSNRKPPVIPTSEEIWETMLPSVTELIVSEILKSEQRMTQRLSMTDLDAAYLQDALGINADQAAQVVDIRRTVQAAYARLLAEQADGNAEGISLINAALTELQLLATEELGLLLSPEQLEQYNEMTRDEYPLAEATVGLEDIESGFEQIEENSGPPPLDPLQKLGQALEELSNPIPEEEGIQFERIPIQTGRFNRSNRNN